MMQLKDEKVIVSQIAEVYGCVNERCGFGVGGGGEKGHEGTRWSDRGANQAV